MTLGIDLSKLPPPKLVEERPYEEILSERIAKFNELAEQRGLSYDLTRADPAYILLEIASWDYYNAERRLNDRTLECLVPYASGPNLDNLLAFRLVQRLDGEDDDDFRRRGLLAPVDYTTGGSGPAYEGFGRIDEVEDIYVYSTENDNPVKTGLIDVRVYFKNQEYLSNEAIERLVEKVKGVLNQRSIKQIGDRLEVKSAKIRTYSVSAVLYLLQGSSSKVVLEEARKRLDDYLSFRKRIGRNVSRNGITSSLFVPNVIECSLAIDIEGDNLNVSPDEIAILRKREDESDDINISIEFIRDENTDLSILRNRGVDV